MEHTNELREKLVIAYKYLIKKTREGCCDNLTEDEFNKLQIISNKQVIEQ